MPPGRREGAGAGQLLRLHPPLLRRAPRPGRAGFPLPAGPSPPRRRLRQGPAPGGAGAAGGGVRGLPGRHPGRSGPPGRLRAPCPPAGRPLPGRHRGAGRGGPAGGPAAGLPPAGGRSDLRRQPEPAAPAGGAGRPGRPAGLVRRGSAGADPLPAHGRGGPPGGAAEPPRPQGPGVPHRQVLRLLLLRVREPAQAHRPAPAQGGDRLHPPVQRAALHPAGGLSGGAGAPPRPCFRRPAGGLCGGHRQRLHHHQRGGARPGGERGRLRHRPHRPKGQPGRGEGLRRPGRLHPGGHGRHRGHRLRPEQHPLRHRAGDRDHLPRPGGPPPVPGGPGHRGHRRPGQQGHLSGRVGRRDQLCDERQVRRRHRTVPGADGPHPGAEPG